MSRGRSRVITRELRFKIEVEGLWNRASVRASTRGLLMSASQSGNFSTSRRVMHEPRGASRLYCPINQNEPGLATDAPPWRGSKRNRPPFHHGHTMKILDRDPARPSWIKDVQWTLARDTRVSNLFLDTCSISFDTNPVKARWIVKNTLHLYRGIYHRDFYRFIVACGRRTESNTICTVFLYRVSDIRGCMVRA